MENSFVFRHFLSFSQHHKLLPALPAAAAVIVDIVVCVDLVCLLKGIYIV